MRKAIAQQFTDEVIIYHYLYYIYIQTIPLTFLYVLTLKPLQIKSAVAVEGLKGYIYIEAYKQTHVKQVCHILEYIFYILLIKMLTIQDILYFYQVHICK